MVEVQVGDGWVNYKGQKEAEEHIMEENLSCFQLTKNTPLKQGKLQDDLGFLVNMLAVEQVLEGTYAIPPGTDPFTREFLEVLGQCNRDAQGGVLHEITKEDF